MAVTRLSLSTESESCSSWEDSRKRKISSGDSTCDGAGRILLWAGGADTRAGHTRRVWARREGSVEWLK